MAKEAGLPAACAHAVLDTKGCRRTNCDYCKATPRDTRGFDSIVRHIRSRAAGDFVAQLRDAG
eukprot:5907944-Prymnesium_polylepis.1